jgi:hypothetical protein
MKHMNEKTNKSKTPFDQYPLILMQAYETFNKLIDNNNKYKNLLKEFYPYIKSNATQAIYMGPSLKNHNCKPICKDCEWYNWALSFMDREQQGEFNEFNI